jgi:hypothetical protein
VQAHLFLTSPMARAVQLAGTAVKRDKICQNLRIYQGDSLTFKMIRFSPDSRALDLPSPRALPSRKDRPRGPLTARHAFLEWVINATPTALVTASTRPRSKHHSRIH